MKYLNVPGLYNSGELHWQTRWEDQFPDQFARVNQDNWDQPIMNNWVQKLNQSIETLQEPTVLIAHSLGCITVAHWASVFSSSYVKGMLLVAPADVEKSTKECFKTFAPVPLDKIPFPSIMIASTNDRYCEIHRAARWAAYWGSRFVCIGAKGHINSESNLDSWPEGFQYLQEGWYGGESYRAAI